MIQIFFADFLLDISGYKLCKIKLLIFLIGFYIIVDFISLVFRTKLALGEKFSRFFLYYYGLQNC